MLKNVGRYLAVMRKIVEGQSFFESYKGFLSSSCFTTRHTLNCCVGFFWTIEMFRRLERKLSMVCEQFHFPCHMHDLLLALCPPSLLELVATWDAGGGPNQ